MATYLCSVSLGNLRACNRMHRTLACNPRHPRLPPIRQCTRGCKPRHPRLQPEAPEAATRGTRGCNPRHRTPGNLLTALVNAAWPADATDVQYYTFFTALMLAAALAFLPVASCYREHSYLPSSPSPAASSPGSGVPAAARREPKPPVLKL